MKVLPSYFIKSYKGKIINIHPSLLPKYKGLNTHKRVISNGEKFDRFKSKRLPHDNTNCEKSSQSAATVPGTSSL